MHLSPTRSNGQHKSDVVALKHICKGRETFICYNSFLCVSMTAQQRGIVLRVYYGFACRCLVCQNQTA